MNRRKMFGILAAPVAAANIPVKSEIKTDLKPYSAFNYEDIYMMWSREYTRSKLGAPADSYITPYAAKGFSVWFELRPPPTPVSVIGGVSYTEIDQAFADACLNGEVPGVWWE